MKIILIISQFLFFSIHAQTINKDFNLFLKDKQVSPAQVSFKVFNITKGLSEVNYNSEKLMIPASIQKLITTSSALKFLGKDFQFLTKVNFKGDIQNNVFKGIIEVVASGDPSLNETFIDAILSKLEEKKIKKIEGYIIVKDTIFDKNVAQSWLVEDVANYYGTAAFGFNFLKNTYKLSLQQSEENNRPKIVSCSPNMKNLNFENELISADENSGDHAYILGMSFSNSRKIVGTIPSGTGIFTIKGAINNPAQIFKNLLLEKFVEKKISFVFQPNLNHKKNAFSLAYKSEKLSEIIKITNHKSINLFAEALLKKIGLERKAYGTTENGIKALTELLNNEQQLIYDGSGLSRKNAISSSFVSDILLQYNKNKAFVNSLSISGISGTMKYFNSEKIKGKIQAKSGSADGILNYAGYFTNSTGDRFTFVFMINNYIGDRKVLRKKMVKVMETFM